MHTELQGDALANAIAQLTKPEPVSIGAVHRLCVDAGAAGERAAARAERVTDDRARRLLGAFAALPTKQDRTKPGSCKYTWHTDSHQLRQSLDQRPNVADVFHGRDDQLHDVRQAALDAHYQRHSER